MKEGSEIVVDLETNSRPPCGAKKANTVSKSFYIRDWKKQQYLNITRYVSDAPEACSSDLFRFPDSERQLVI